MKIIFMMDCLWLVLLFHERVYEKTPEGYPMALKIGWLGDKARCGVSLQWFSGHICINPKLNQRFIFGEKDYLKIHPYSNNPQMELLKVRKSTPYQKRIEVHRS